MTTSENLLAAEIVDCFASSQQPELLKQAEAKLQELQTFHDFIPTLITLGLHNQQAAIYLKNFLKQKKQVDLKTVRLIFDGIQKSQETKKIILSSFQVILSKVNVQELLKPVTEMFTKDIMTATLILVEIVKHFQWYQSEKRQVLNSFIRQLFPGKILLL